MARVKCFPNQIHSWTRKTPNVTSRTKARLKHRRHALHNQRLHGARRKPWLLQGQHQIHGRAVRSCQNVRFTLRARRVGKDERVEASSRSHTHTHTHSLKRGSLCHRIKQAAAPCVGIGSSAVHGSHQHVLACGTMTPQVTTQRKQGKPNTLAH